MYNQESPNAKSSTLKDNPLFNLILIAMNNNTFSLQKYKLIMNATTDTHIKNSIQCAYDNKLKHSKLFSQIFRYLTGQSVEIPRPNIKIHNSTIHSIGDCIDTELEEIKLFKEILNLTSSEKIKTTVKNMITDNQRIAASLNFLYARESLNRNPSSVTGNNISLTFKEMKSAQKYINEDLKIPILTGIKDAKIQNKINNSLKDDVLEFKRQMEEAANEDGVKAKKEGKTFKNYVISNNPIITYNKNNIVSISNLYYEFINGRHYYIRVTYNFNINTGVPIGLKDLFNPGAPYIELVNKEIKKQLAANKTMYSSEAAQNFKGISEGHPFYLEDANIVLFFSFNEIAPTISEIPIIKLPFKAFTGYIKPMFLN